MKKLSLTLAVILFSANIANAETFNDALVSTYKSNPTLLAKRASLRYTNENVAIAKSNYRPDVYASLSASTEDNKRELQGVAMSSIIPNTPYGASAVISQPLFRGYRTTNTVASAKQGVMAEMAGLYSTEQSVLLSAATSYINVLRDKLILDLRKNNEKVLEENLEAAKIRFKAGEITKTDVSQSESRLARASSNRIAAEGDLETSKALYQRVVGYLPEDLGLPIELEDKMPKTLQEALDEAIASNFNIKYSEYLLKASKRDTASVKGELLPSVDLNAIASRDWDSGDYSQRSYQLVAEMKVPLYKTGSVRARIRQSKYLQWKRQDELNKAKRIATEEVTAAWQKWQANKAQIQSTKAQITATNLALEGVTIESQAGSRTVLDVLDAEQELLDAKVDMAIAMRNEYLSALILLSAMGDFTAKNFSLDVELYDPVKHFAKTEGKWLSSSVEKR